MADFIKLVPEAVAEDEVRESVLAVLQEMLGMAEAGVLNTVIVIAGRVDGDWMNRYSETVCFSEAIGRLEITKQEWVKNYMKENFK